MNIMYNYLASEYKGGIMMDTNKKILIGAISADVVIGGVAIGGTRLRSPHHHGGRDSPHF